MPFRMYDSQVLEWLAPTHQNDLYPEMSYNTSSTATKQT